MSVEYIYIVSNGKKFLHMDPVNGVTWGTKKGAFEFDSMGDANRAGTTLLPAGSDVKVHMVVRK